MKKYLLLLPVLFLCFTQANARTDVTNQYLKNADLKSLANWNYGDNGYNYTDWKTDGSVPVIEFYHTWSANPGTAIGDTRNFHLTQATTLPVGDYRLVINAFYREGKGDGTSKAVIIGGTQEKIIRGLNEGEINGFSGSNALYRAANAFSLGYFPNYIDITIDEEQEIVLGISGYIDTYDSWCILGPVKLYQYESGEAKTEEDDPVIPTKYVAPDWSDYPITFNHSWTDYTSSFTSPSITSGETSMTATVTADQDATLVFEYGNRYVSNYGNLNVYLDNLLVETVNSVEWSSGTKPYFVEMNAGEHTVKWTYVCNNTTSASATIQNIGIIASPTITVNLLEPGSLGTEVLYNTDHIKNVRKLVVTGNMNDEDWTRIKMMTNLLSLDLSGTNITAIPYSCFTRNNFSFLHYLRLPETLTSIGGDAFYESYIDDINFPSSLKSIGSSAFSRSKIREAMLPNTMNSLGDGAFSYCSFLKKANFPSNIKVMPSRTYQECTQLSDLTLHEGLEEIKLWGMRSIPYNKNLPSTITTIGEGACADSWALPDTLIIPKNCTSMGLAAFQNCTSVKVVVLPIGYYQCNSRDVFNFWNIETLVIKSPTLLSGSGYKQIVPEGRRGSITLKVPNYLVNSYKLDEYWYEFGKIEGFSTSEIQDWTIKQPLVLNNGRFEGTPNISLHLSASLKINGNAPMTINNLWFTRDWNSSSGWNTQILSNCENITIGGTVSMTHFCPPDKWNFVCLPFDVKVSEIYNEDAQYAIRYYDGASRAQNGTGGNWKNFSEDDIIPAGTGFILQPSGYSSTHFVAVNNDQKQFVVSNKEFVKTLAENASEASANKGWNLIGNPWHCYYNIHKLNFTAPITVWNPDNKTYTAYSLTDDDYAIRPNEAFFVQCPNEEYNTIGFPVQGRQLTSVIESQNAVKEWAPEAKSRQVVNLTVSNGEMEDMTRVVLNEEASMAYETSCDASKFMSMDGSVPQIYTMDGEGTWYAINERPVEDSSVALGFYAGQEGSYTISVTRCDAERVFLTDNLTGETSDITNGSYTFSAKAGTDNTRFTLSFVANDPTAIEDVEKVKNEKGERDVYDLNGRQIVNAKLSQGIYIIRQGKKANKVIIR